MENKQENQKPQLPLPASLDQLKDMLARGCSFETDALFEKHCKGVCDSYKASYSSFNQAANALAIIRSLKEIDPQFGTKAKGGRFDEAQWTKIQSICYRGGNASAARQAISGEKKSGAIASAYAAGNVD